jgi:hypothetical protein
MLVIDDFTTESDCFETARNFLLNAGASQVTTIAVGKYGMSPRYNTRAPILGTRWNSFAPAELSKAQFEETAVRGAFDDEALQYFTRTYTPPAPPSLPLADHDDWLMASGDEAQPVREPVTTTDPGGDQKLLETVQAQWPIMRMLCKQRVRGLYVLLISARARAVEPGFVPVVVIETDYQFHYDRLREPSMQDALEWALEQVLDTPVAVRIVQA